MSTAFGLAEMRVLNQDDFKLNLVHMSHSLA